MIAGSRRRLYLASYFPDEDESRSKMLGVFSSSGIARDAAGSLEGRPGFPPSIMSDIFIDEYEVDELRWAGGFFRVLSYEKGSDRETVSIALTPRTRTAAPGTQGGVYLLWHLGPSPESMIYGGLFGSRAVVGTARSELSRYPGFDATPLEFGISVHAVDELCWAAGFRDIAIRGRYRSASSYRALMVHNNFGPTVRLVSNGRVMAPGYRHIPATTVRQNYRRG